MLEWMAKGFCKMNNNFLNDCLERCIRSSPDYLNGSKLFNDFKGLNRILKAPLFKIGFPDEKFVSEAEADESEMFFSNSGLLCLPFQEVRCIDSTVQAKEFRFGYLFGRGNHEEVGETFYIMTIIKHESRSCPCVVGVNIVGKVEDLKKCVQGKREIKTVTYQTEIYPKGRSVWFNEMSEIEQKKSSDIVMISVRRLIDFMSMVNCPRHFISQVKPKIQGRSVEWVQRKTHYIILGPEHSKRLLNGERGQFDGTITS